MSAEIRITITKDGQVLDDVGLEFATKASMPSLPIDALDAFLASAAWRLVTDFADEFKANEDGTIRQWWVNEAFDPSKPETAFDPKKPGDGNSLMKYADLTPARCVAVALRRHGEKLVFGRNLVIARQQAEQQAKAGSELITQAVSVKEYR